MADLQRTAPAFVEMAHSIAWCSVSTVDRSGRPRSRILHPYWTWDGQQLLGWVGTTTTPLKVAHLRGSPFVSCQYWAPSHDNCVAECRAEWVLDDQTRTTVWELVKNAPAPVG